jgi:hypothetical protein
MPLFDPPVPRRLLWPKNAPWPKRRAQALLKKFQSCFPMVLYDMDLGVLLANAQAFRAGKQKHVRLYGGLVRHRWIGSAGLAFALAHETGHHLGGAPFLQYLPWLSSEERASEWATTCGLPVVFGVDRADVVTRRGVTQLKAIGLFD